MMVLANTKDPEMPEGVKAYLEDLAAKRAAERKAQNRATWKTGRNAKDVRNPVPSDPRMYSRGNDEERTPEITDGKYAEHTTPLDTVLVVRSAAGITREVDAR